MFSNTPLLLLHSKKTSRRPVRTQHTTRWWKQAKPGNLTARAFENSPSSPFQFSHFNEEVDRPYVPPKDGATCFQCCKPVDIDVEHAGLGHVWVPSGDMKNSGYFFHSHCFRCKQCGFRLHHNKFYSLASGAAKSQQGTSAGGGAVCMNCAMGRPPVYPTRWWHGSMHCVAPGRAGSRITGHIWPRHQHQMDELYDPDT